MKKTVVALVMFALFYVSPVVAQDAKPTEARDYAQVIAKRSAKIVAALHSTDTVFNNKVQAIIVDQYYQLSRIHDTRNAQIKNIKA